MKETIAINNLRTLACDMISNVKSGHPGIALGATPIYLAILKSMKSSAKHSNHILRAELNMGLDNIILREDLSSIDIIKMFL